MSDDEERANEHLVEAAYNEAKEQILAMLDGRVRERDRWIKRADDELREFWLKVRARGVPDRTAERDAFARLAADIRQMTRGGR